MGKCKQSKKCNCNKCQNKCYNPCGTKCVEVFEAILSPEQEVAFTESYGNGYIKAVLTDNCLVISGYFENLRGKYDCDVGTHIHNALAGTNGDIVFTLDPSVCPTKKSGFFNPSCNTFSLSEDQIRQLKDRKYYINIHSDIFPAGELRGQLLPKSHKYYVIRLSGLNEVPPVTTAGNGIFVGELNQRNLTVSGSFGDLGSVLIVGSGINQGAVGATGPQQFVLGIDEDLDQLGGDVEAQRNVYALTCKQEAALKSNNFYANITTTGQPTGEIRGQFLPLY